MDAPHSASGRPGLFSFLARAPDRVKESTARASLFETALSGAVTERTVSKSTRVRTFTTPSTILFETLDMQADGIWVHKSFINKGKETVTVPLDRNSLLRPSQYPQGSSPNSNR